MNISASNKPIGLKIKALHHDLNSQWPELNRISVAIYDNESDEIKTFVNSDNIKAELNTYSAKLSDVPSLKQLADEKQDRIVSDIETFSGSDSVHSQWVLDAGFKSSYTVPLFGQENLLGFLFFNASKPHFFNNPILKTLKVYAQLIEAVLINELAPVYTLRGAINTAKYLTHQRDSETAAHIKRMSRYSHLIARRLAKPLGLNDEYVEFILQYSPLHDVGKIGISDELLLKPGKLTMEEFIEVKRHVNIGIQIIDAVISEFDLGQLKHVQILRNIIKSHHEKFDGSGYPKGLKGDAIPLEGRIVAVADVLDALSQSRPYKLAWDFDEAVHYIVNQAGYHFDPVCVDVVTEHIEEFRLIYNTFMDD